METNLATAERTDREDQRERLDGIREDLANAVAWGTVTTQQAADFYARMRARITRGH